MSDKSYKQNLKDLKTRSLASVGCMTAGAALLYGAINLDETFGKSAEASRKTAFDSADILFEDVYAPMIPRISSAEQLEQLSRSNDSVQYLAICVRDQWNANAPDPSFKDGVFSLPAQNFAIDRTAVKTCFQDNYAQMDSATNTVKALGGGTVTFMVLFSLVAGGMGAANLLGAGASGVRLLRNAADENRPPVSAIRRFGRYLRDLH